MAFHLEYLSVVNDVLDTAESKDYSGYSKFDALNSPILRKLSFENKWINILFTQLVKECPINVRPFLLVEKSRNPKGIALFARAYLFLFEITKDPVYLDKAKNLLGWLLSNNSPGSHCYSWGYNYLWQSPLFLQDENEPNTVVSVFVGEALLHAFEQTQNSEYLDACISVSNFILKELPVLFESDTECAFAYVKREVSAIVLNNQVLIGAFLAKLWKYSGDSSLLDMATKCIRFTVNRKTPYDCWYYTYPSDKSHIRHDNYHTGGILDGLIEYFEYTKDDQFLETYSGGLTFYSSNLFGPDGEPYWMNDKKFPFDIHGSAQGIITFAKASTIKPEYLTLSKKIASWAITNLYNSNKNHFNYRKGRFLDWNYSLMRWCNGWMARALSELILTNNK